MKNLVFESLSEYMKSINEGEEVVDKNPEDEKKEEKNDSDSSSKFDDFMENFGEKLSSEIVKKAKEIRGKQKKSGEGGDIKESANHQPLNEGLILMAVSAAFASPAMLSTFAKIVKFLSGKIKFKKGENIAEKIEKVSHKIHHAIQVPFEKLGKVFGIKDRNKNKFAELTVGFITLALLIVSGIGLTHAISHINTAHIASEGVLSALKSKELSDLALKIAKSIGNAS